MNITYNPLSLEKLCINLILKEIWQSDFDEILKNNPFLKDELWEKKFRERYEIIKWCMNKKKISV